MKWNILNFKEIFLFAILLLWTLPLSLQGKEFTRTIEKSYPINADGEVNIENQHGMIEIIQWENNEVTFEIVIRIHSNSEKVADDAFSRIEIDFSNSEEYISAKTEVESVRSFWWFFKSWWSEASVQIDYRVYVPQTISLEIENKYGNVEIEEIHGDVVVEMRHGDLRIKKALGDLKLDLAYGSGVIVESKEAQVEISFYKLRINTIGFLDIDSQHSRVTVEKAAEIISESSYDSYVLGETGIFKNDGKYDNIKIDDLFEASIDTKRSDLTVERLKNSLRVNATYGSLRIESVERQFKEIRVESEYTGIYLEFGSGSYYKIDIHTESSSVLYPEEIQIIKEQKDDHKFSMEGFLGSEKAAGEIYIRMEYGGLRIK